MIEIGQNLEKIKRSLSQEVTLVAVSKTKSVEEILQAYEAGHRIFGENKIQEMVTKWEVMPKDIQWHMIGHIQTNKVKYMASFVSLIHGVDSLKLLKEINKQALKHDRVIECLLQIKIASEDSKFGMSETDAEAVFASEEFENLQNIKIVGLMGMASFTNDQAQLSKEFSNLKSIFERFRLEHKELTKLSMGMSGDYPLAITHGSTMVRVGSAIFGSRNY